MNGLRAEYIDDASDDLAVVNSTQVSFRETSVGVDRDPKGRSFAGS